MDDDDALLHTTLASYYTGDPSVGVGLEEEYSSAPAESNNSDLVLHRPYHDTSFRYDPDDQQFDLAATNTTTINYGNTSWSNYHTTRGHADLLDILPPPSSESDYNPLSQSSEVSSSYHTQSEPTSSTVLTSIPTTTLELSPVSAHVASASDPPRSSQSRGAGAMVAKARQVRTSSANRSAKGKNPIRPSTLRDKDKDGSSVLRVDRARQGLPALPFGLPGPGGFSERPSLALRQPTLLMPLEPIPYDVNLDEDKRIFPTAVYLYTESLLTSNDMFLVNTTKGSQVGQTLNGERALVAVENALLRWDLPREY